MAGKMNKAVWWTCDKCNAQVAISAAVFTPIEPPVTQSRRAFYEWQPGEVWGTHLLIDGKGLAMRRPKYCPHCGVEIIER